MIYDLTNNLMSTGTMDSLTKLALATLWRRTLTNIITILAKAAKAMWSLKEDHRRNDLPTSRKRGCFPDIRPYLRAQRRRIGSLHSSSLNLKKGSTAECVRKRLYRISSRRRTYASTLQSPLMNHHIFSHYVGYNRTRRNLGNEP